MKVWVNKSQGIGGEALVKVQLEKEITTSLLVAGELSVSVFVCLCLFVCLSACLYVCISVFLHIFPSFLFFWLSFILYLSVSLFSCLSMKLSRHFFPVTSKDRQIQTK